MRRLFSRISFAGASLSALLGACSIVFDTETLVSDPGGGGTGGGAATAGASSTAGGGSGPTCECAERGDLFWLVVEEGLAVDAPDPVCPDGEAAASGAVVGTLDTSTPTMCSGDCQPACNVRIELGDDCTVSGAGIAGDGACHAATLVADGAAHFKITVERVACSPVSLLDDGARTARASICAAGPAACAPPASTRRCIPSSSGECPDPCFAERVTLATLLDDRSCTNVPNTCTSPCVGVLSWNADASCNDPTPTAYFIDDANLCEPNPPSPDPPAGSPTYWSFSPDVPPCTANTAPQGRITVEGTVAEVCCA